MTDVRIGTFDDSLNSDGTSAEGWILFGGTMAVAQTILAPPSAKLLDNFKLYIAADPSGNSSSFRSFVLRWDDTLAKARGLLLYLSDTISPVAHEETGSHHFDEFVFPAKVKLQPGLRYVIGVTGAFASQNGLSAIAATQNALTYGDGDVVQLELLFAPFGPILFLLNADFRTWTKQPMGLCDLAFEATITL